MRGKGIRLFDLLRGRGDQMLRVSTFLLLLASFFAGLSAVLDMLSPKGPGVAFPFTVVLFVALLFWGLLFLSFWKLS